MRWGFAFDACQPWRKAFDQDGFSAGFNDDLVVGMDADLVCLGVVFEVAVEIDFLGFRGFAIGRICPSENNVL